MYYRPVNFPQLFQLYKKARKIVVGPFFSIQNFRSWKTAGKLELKIKLALVFLSEK